MDKRTSVIRFILFFLLGLLVLLPLLALGLDAAGMARQWLPREWVDVLNAEFEGNSISAWLQAAIIFISSFLGLITLDHILETEPGILTRVERHRSLRLLNHLANRTSKLFIFVLAVRLGVSVLELPHKVDAIIITVFTLAIFIQMALWLNEIVGEALVRLAQRQGGGNGAMKNAMQLIRGAARITVWVIALVLILDNLGFNVSTLLAGLGIGGAAIALASQNILSDIFASLGIVLDKPFVVGDFVVLGTQMGTIESIGIKTTRLRSLSGEQIVVPNSDLLKARIHNYRRMQERRVVVRFRVTYETESGLVEAVPGMVRAIVEEQPQARLDRIHLDALGENALEYELVYYINSADYNLYMDIRQAINFSILRQFRAEGINIWHPPSASMFINALKSGS